VNRSRRDVLKSLLLGFPRVLKSMFRRIDYSNIALPVNLTQALAILALIGLARTMISVLLGIRFHGGLWFSFDPGVVLTMLVYPAFLCFFPAMAIDYACRSWKTGIETRTILGLAFFLQFVHLGIPFLESIQRTLRFPVCVPLIPLEKYGIAAVSPLALTPAIFLVTRACTFGITAAWLIATVVLIRFGSVNRVPMVRFLILLAAVFYLVYVITYPTYWLFFLYGNNFFYAMTYLVGAVGPVLYFKSRQTQS
jgi:hypothetical protein